MNTALLTSLLAWDEALFKIINTLHSGVFDIFFLACSALGSSWGIIPAVTVFILLAAGKRRLAVVLAAAAATLVGGAFLTSSIKQGVARPRPAVYFQAPAAGTAETAEREPPFDVHVVGRRLVNSYSFPSGHSWTAFAAAAFLTLYFGRRYAWAFLAAAAIGYSRIYVGAHFPLDVLGGAAGGTLLAVFVWLPAAWLAPKQARPPASLRPADGKRRRHMI